MPKFTRLTVALFATMTLGLSSTPGWSAVRVSKKPLVVKHVTFDPEKPGKDVPPMHPGEVAVCGSDFGVAARVGSQPRMQRTGSGRYICTIVVDSVDLDIDLQIRIFLPKEVSEKVKAHEEGHRQISEKIYAEVATHAARVAGEKLDHQRFEAEADTARDAEKQARDAMTAAHTEMIHAYLEETSRAGKKIQDEYDTVTRHGMNLELAEVDAIKQCWEKFTPPMWEPPKPPATKPTLAKPATRPTAKTASK